MSGKVMCGGLWPKGLWSLAYTRWLISEGMLR